mgnify:CR=1 FL=1
MHVEVEDLDAGEGFTPAVDVDARLDLVRDRLVARHGTAAAAGQHAVADAEPQQPEHRDLQFVGQVGDARVEHAVGHDRVVAALAGGGRRGAEPVGDQRLALADLLGGVQRGGRLLADVLEDHRHPRGAQLVVARLPTSQLGLVDVNRRDAVDTHRFSCLRWVRPRRAR